jgi:type IV pilus assembly protein PilB
MRIPDSLAINLLKKSGNFSDEQIESLYEESRRQRRPLQDIIIDNNLLNEAELTKLYSEEIGLPYVELDSKSIDPEHLHTLDQRLARKHGAVIFGNEADGVRLVAVVNPDDLESLNFLKKKNGSHLKLHLATPRAVDQALSSYPNTSVRLVKPPGVQPASETSGLSKSFSAEEALHLIIENAILDHASDIHIEPREQYILVRYRIDGRLRPVTKLPIRFQATITEQLKQLVSIEDSKNLLPRSDSFKVELHNHSYLVKLSIVPLIDGEKVVLGLLNESRQAPDLNELGLWGSQLNALNQALAQPHGLILVNGPSGSGKSTTLASILSKLTAPGLNLTTIEDPVVYRLPNASQLAVNTDRGVSYEQGLKTVLDQGANIIMIDKLKDAQLAHSALEAASKGHLLLSSLYSRNAAGCFSDLKDMGIELYLMASSIRLVISQGLVRRLCMHCREMYKPNLNDIKKLDKDFALASNLKVVNQLEKVARENFMPAEKQDNLSSGPQSIHRLWRASKNGCFKCGYTGYKERTCLFEVVSVSESVQKAIVAGSTKTVLDNILRNEGQVSLKLDGLIKALLGLTTLDEVISATRALKA